MFSLLRDRLYDVRDSVLRDEFFSFHTAVRPYTECGNVRLRSLYEAVRHVVAHNIPGDIVECGVARGGSAGLLGLTLHSLGTQRLLWAFDTFEGMPPPSAGDPDRDIAQLYTGAFCGAYDDVRSLLGRHQLLDRSRLVKGMLQETLPATDVSAVAVLHIDCDWYESVLVCLERIYDRVSPGGVIQFDDYGHWEGARRAVDEFLARRSICTPLEPVDYAGRVLVKPRSPADPSV